jgi:hypothetical protein
MLSPIDRRLSIPNVPYKYAIRLTGHEKQVLRQAKRRGAAPARLIVRILIILMADQGKTLAASPVAALPDLPRSGRPCHYTAADRAQMVAVVCETLHAHDLPLSRFSMTDLLPIVRRDAALPQVSRSTLARLLHQHALKPWRYRYWLYPRDPAFETKACRVLDLYAGRWDGQALTADEYIISADEKTIQVLQRRHPGQPPVPGYIGRVEFEYQRHGTIAYHAAWDVHRGHIFGRVAPTTCIATFRQLIDLVMQQEPYRSAARPGSSGSWTAAAPIIPAPFQRVCRPSTSMPPRWHYRPIRVG